MAKGDNTGFGMRFTNSRWMFPQQITHGSIFGRTGCLAEDTEIYVHDGKLKKEKLLNLPNSFKVVSYNFTTEKKEVKDAVKINTGLKECYEIVLENGKKIVATGDHVFYRDDNTEVKVSELSVGDDLLMTNKVSNVVGTSKQAGSYNVNMGFRDGNIPWLKGKHWDKEKYRDGLKAMGLASKLRWHNKPTFLAMYGKERADIIKNRMKGKRPDMCGDNNPSRRADVREKLSRASSLFNGMKNKTHSEETKARIRTSVRASVEHEKMADYQRGNTFENMYGVKKALEMKSKLSFACSGEKNPSFGIPRYPKLYKPDSLNHKVRSSWEEHVCKLLVTLNIPYLYEPTAFKIILDDKTYTYTPDMGIGNNCYIEVKGPLFYHQLDKMKAFKQQYSKNKLIIITSEQNISKFDLSFADLLLNYYDINATELKNEIYKN